MRNPAPQQSSSLLIAWYSQSGASAALARAAWQGACAADAGPVQVARSWDVGSRELLAARGLLLVGAENAGSLSGGLKDFLDRTFYPVSAREHVIPYALIISAGNDGRGARRLAESMLSGYPLRRATDSLILRGEPDDAALQQARDLGEAFATGLEMGIF